MLPFREREIRGPAGPLHDRVQRLATAHGIDAREAHFAVDLHALLPAPLRQFLDVDEVVWLQFDVRGWISAQYRGHVDHEEFGLPGLPVHDTMPRQFRLPAVGGVLEAPAGPDQVADMHAGLERIPAR